jgi:hypothetical protein
MIFLYYVFGKKVNLQQNGNLLLLFRAGDELEEDSRLSRCCLLTFTPELCPDPDNNTKTLHTHPKTTLSKSKESQSIIIVFVSYNSSSPERYKLLFIHPAQNTETARDEILETLGLQQKPKCSEMK